MVFATVLFIFVLVYIPRFSTPYNVDIAHPVIFANPVRGVQTYFGYSVALNWGPVRTPIPSLFVGAPQAREGRGALYRCPVNNTFLGVGPLCQMLNVDPASEPDVVSVRTTRRVVVTEIGRNGWMGASMATRETSDLTVCAARTIVKLEVIPRNQLGANNLHDMRGICYDVPAAAGNTLYRDNEILKSYNFSMTPYANAQYGFSINYGQKKGSNTIERIIGEPGLNTVEIVHKNRTVIRSHPANEYSNLGYAVSSGYFFHHSKLLFVAGAPTWNDKGLVIVFDPNSNQEKTIQGSLLGEYFGASLATGDFDGDGLDDIAVGAPHWGDVNYGRVYTFYANDDGTFRNGLMLQGLVQYGQFGYTLASADLDRDGYADVVVSAPWEASGAVYIYYGNSNFGTDDRSSPIIKRIVPSDITQTTIQRFGFSLAHPTDIDDNGYPDLAIGAYKSGHVVVLRSKPVIRTTINLFSYPVTLQPQLTPNFNVSVCINYRGSMAAPNQEFNIEIAVDEEYRRVEKPSIRILTAFFQRDTSCVNATFILKRRLLNPIDPIVVNVKHNVNNNRVEQENQFCPHCPVLSRRNLVKTTQMRIPFNTGCSNRIVCNARLAVSANFSGLENGDLNEWVVGSGDIGLNISVTNEDEPSYLTQLRIEIPPGVALRSAIPSCMESQGNGIVLTCDVGNPLITGEAKEMIIGLDMGHIIKSAGGTVLPFVMKATTRSTNHGETANFVLPLKLKNKAYVTLTGMTNEESHAYERKRERSKVRLRHTYQVLKFGATPVTEARLDINVPVALDGKNSTFLNISIPTISISGKLHECLIKHVDDVGEEPVTEDTIVLLKRRRRDFGNLKKPSSLEERRVIGLGISTKNESEGWLDDAQRNETLKNQDSGTGGLINDQTIFINCSTPDVICSRITCRFDFLKTYDDIGNLILDMDFDTGLFFSINQDSTLNVRFSTNASVKIIQPRRSEPANIIRSTLAVVSTTLYTIPEPQKLATWILPSSIVLGVILFCILAYILLKFGFFKRPKKDAQKAAKSKDLEMISKKDAD